MRVVFLTHNYPRHPGDPAGSFLHTLAVALQGLGAELSVVAPSDQGQGGSGVMDGIPVRRVRYGSPRRERYAYTGRMQDAIRSPGGLLALRSLHRALREGTRAAAAGHPGTVVHAHWWFPAGLAAPPELPTVTTVHGTDGRLLSRSAGRLLGRQALGRAARVTAVSRDLAAVITRATGRQDVSVQPMAVDSSGLAWSHGGGGLVVISRLTAQKRVGLVLEALARMASGARPHTVIVGDGPERQQLEAQAALLGLGGQVRFHGAVPPSEVATFLATADLAVQAGQGEGFGLAAAEALMAGVPVIGCHDGGGLLDVVTGEGGTRLADPDALSLAKALESALNDRSLHEEAREAARVWRDRLSPTAVATRFLSWYQEAADAQ